MNEVFLFRPILVDTVFSNVLLKDLFLGLSYAIYAYLRITAHGETIFKCLRAEVFLFISHEQLLMSFLNFRFLQSLSAVTNADPMSKIMCLGKFPIRMYSHKGLGI